MITRLRPTRRPSDEGMTMVELLVSVVLLGVVMVLIGTMMVQTMWIQRHTTSINEASNDAQNVLTDIELGVRNSALVDIKNVAGGDQLLVIKRRSTAVGGATSGVCAGWYYDASERRLHSATDAASGIPRTVTAWATPATALNWPIALEDVERLGAAPVFGASGDLLTVAFRVETTKDEAPVEMSGQGRSRPGDGAVGGVSCT